MEKQIAQIRNKMIAMIAIILLVSAWQHEFIAEGVTAHVYVTGSILAAFAFSIVMAFVFVSKLKNEVIAFNALKEMWDDIRIGPSQQASDPLWRHYRCSRPGRVFRRPRLLGHAYDLVTEELARTKKIRISVETMNTLVHKISQTIDDEKSLLGYMSGLLVFMGLIGTFIGLLHMVGSMGGIIGSLAGSADAAGPDAFQKLLGALQEPLKGMASGFAASLFGLFSSLVVGLLNRMAGQAAGVLKHEFESWLAGVVQIGDQEREDAMAPRVAWGGEGQLDGTLVQATANMMGDYARVATNFDAAIRLLHSLQARQQDQGELMESVVQTLSRVGVGLEALSDGVSKTVAAELAATRTMLQDLARVYSGDLKLLASGHADTSVQLAAAIEQNAQQLSTQLSDNIEARIHHAVKEAIAPMGLTVADQMQKLEKAFSQSPQHKPVGDAATERGNFEDELSESFDDLNQSMGAALSGYAGVLKQAASALDTSEQELGRAFDRGQAASDRTASSH
jgi:hypothetical protein